MINTQKPAKSRDRMATAQNQPIHRMQNLVVSVILRLKFLDKKNSEGKQNDHTARTAACEDTHIFGRK